MQPSKLQNQILTYLQSPEYRPMKAHEILRRLGISPKESRVVRDLLRTLEADGQVERISGNRLRALPDAPEVEGILSVHAQGFGFLNVAADAGELVEVFIPAQNMEGARHRDRVRVRLSAAGSGRSAEKQMSREGRVVEILDRHTNRIVGLVKKISGTWQVVPDDPRHQEVMQLHDGGIPPQELHKVVVEVEEPDEAGGRIFGRIVEDLGHIDDDGVEILGIMRAHNLHMEFPDEVMREVDAATLEICPETLAGRTDFRDWLTFTIDPFDAKDFDDALSLRRLDDGHFELGVHIADVAHFVQAGSRLDEEAKARGTSAYLVDRVVEMLPSKLTRDLCSLVPNRDRFTHSVVLTLTRNGDVRGSTTCRSVIHSDLRLNYEQVQRMIETGENPEIPPHVAAVIRDLVPLTRRLRAARMEAGALGFDVPEIKCLLDERGEVTRIIKREAMEAYQVIEECMLLANRVVGEMLASRYGTAIYRIHEEPSASEWEKMGHDLRELGLNQLPVSRNTLNAIVDGDLPEHLRYPVTVTILKNLKRAMYAARPGVHFGLAFDVYSHFTSPIRRYPDLIAHRLLLAVEEDRPCPMDNAALQAAATQCSLQERNAAEAEKATVEVKRIRYYHRLLWDKKVGPYPAVVTGLVPRGILVELVDTLQRGLIAWTRMGDDYYELNPSGTRAFGKRSQRRICVGDEMEVCIVQVDLQRRLVDFMPAEKESPPRKARSPRRSAPRRKKR